MLLKFGNPRWQSRCQKIIIANATLRAKVPLSYSGSFSAVLCKNNLKATKQLKRRQQIIKLMQTGRKQTSWPCVSEAKELNQALPGTNPVGGKWKCPDSVTIFIAES